MKPSERLIQLTERLETQDNRATAHPIFLVQQEHRIYGMDPAYTDLSVWEPAYDNECYYETAEEAMVHEGLDGTDDLKQVFYVIEWRYVSAHFTEQAAVDYIEGHKHNLDNPRIYVASQDYCHEWNETVDSIKRIAKFVNADTIDHFAKLKPVK
jgi:hypothetical protein